MQTQREKTFFQFTWDRKEWQSNQIDRMVYFARVVCLVLLGLPKITPQFPPFDIQKSGSHRGGVFLLLLLDAMVFYLTGWVRRGAGG